MHFDLFFWIDLVVIALYFFTVIFVGLKFGERENSLDDFSLGSRSIPWLAVLASIIAAETSAATFLGTPGEGYELVNYTYLQIAIGTIIEPDSSCLFVHQTIFRLQRLLHLRISRSAFWHRYANRGVDDVSNHKSTGFRGSTLCIGNRPGRGLQSLNRHAAQRQPADSDSIWPLSS